MACLTPSPRPIGGLPRNETSSDLSTCPQAVSHVYLLPLRIATAAPPRRSPSSAVPRSSCWSLSCVPRFSGIPARLRPVRGRASSSGAARRDHPSAAPSHRELAASRRAVAHLGLELHATSFEIEAVTAAARSRQSSRLCRLVGARLRGRELALPLRGLRTRIGAGSSPRPAGRPAHLKPLPTRKRSRPRSSAGKRSAPHP